MTNIITNADGSITIAMTSKTTYGADIPVPVLAALGAVVLQLATSAIVWAMAKRDGDSN